MPASPIPIPLGSSPYLTAYTSVGRERCENLYLERSGSKTSKAEEFYVKIAGLRRVHEGSSTNACRGLMRASNGRLFGVYGQYIYETLTDWTQVLRGSLGTYSGTVGMEDDGQRMLIVDGQDGWTLKYENNVLERIDPNHAGDEGFPRGATHAVCLDTYFLVNNPNTNDYAWSNQSYSLMTTGGITTGATPENAGHWNGLNTASKIAHPDNIVAICDCNNMAWLFGQTSVEVHYDTGEYPGTWARYEGAIIETGCSAKYSVKRYMNNVYWIGSDRTGTVGVFTNNGFAPQRISTRGIEQIMQSMSNYTDAIGLTWAENGHAFYMIHFPTGDRTLVYDIVTGVWHERTYLYRQDGTTHRWKGNYVAYFNGQVVFGDNVTDALYVSDQYYYVNDDPTGNTVNYIKCVKTTPIGFQSGKMVRYKSIQPMLAQGVGLAQNTDWGVGEDPKIIIQASNDSGNTWTQGRLSFVGKRGEYDRRSRLTTWGMARNRVWSLTYTEPTPYILIGLLADIQVLVA